MNQGKDKRKGVYMKTVPKLPSFTPRELDVAKLLARGQSRKQIADTLKLSVHTLANYLSKIRWKTDTHSMMEAACFLAKRF
jgi:DNA-binding NarL/FixJ family response regulator